ncbi:hypothetical protein [Roseomonas indoligenes]|uniref:Uncharacterized protein n=1 Tax=Roseomonas indoligenes TaxID=2820811 RepID=A0A940MTC6_9PROT|nr:hypothetical protein [Pararoseomonas indoligenes]MBP0493054.1 hypothetical protein [Pararoseomonas indoligenes]
MSGAQGFRPARMPKQTAAAEQRSGDEIAAINAEGEMIVLLQQARAMMRAPEPCDPFPTLASLLSPKPWEAPLHAAAGIPATSQAGIRAKAETVADWLAGQDRRTGPGFSCDRETAVAWSLMRDILGADELAPVPPPRRAWTETDELAAAASMPPPVVLPAVPDIPWMWSNAAHAIAHLPVQGYRLSTAGILEAQRAQEAHNDIRAHNLLMAASAAVHEQMRELDVQYAINTDVRPKEAPLVPGTPEYREHQAMQVRTMRAIVRGNLRELRRVQKEHGLPLPPDDGSVMVQVDEPGFAS